MSTFQHSTSNLIAGYPAELAGRRCIIRQRGVSEIVGACSLRVGLRVAFSWAVPERVSYEPSAGME